MKSTNKQQNKMKPTWSKIICRVCFKPTLKHESVYGAELCEECDEALEVITRRNAFKTP